MNYRINGTRAMIDSLISSSMHEVLLFNDQLRIEMKKGAVFPGFEEGPLHFAPTYKFDANSDAYDSSKKQRIPAWTDRILFKAVRCFTPSHCAYAWAAHDLCLCVGGHRAQPKGSMRLQAYDSIPSIRSSDHRPVVAVFEVSRVVQRCVCTAHVETAPLMLCRRRWTWPSRHRQELRRDRSMQRARKAQVRKTRRVGRAVT